MASLGDLELAVIRVLVTKEGKPRDKGLPSARVADQVPAAVPAVLERMVADQRLVRVGKGGANYTAATDAAAALRSSPTRASRERKPAPPGKRNAMVAQLLEVLLPHLERLDQRLARIEAAQSSPSGAAMA